MRLFWEILPLFLIFLFVLLAGYIVLAPGAWRVSHSVRLLAGGVLLVYAAVRGAFWFRRWKNRPPSGYK